MSRASAGRKIGAVSALALVLTLAGTGPAYADKQKPPSGNNAKIEIPLTFVGIDETQAAKAGNLVVEKDGFKVLVDGRTGQELGRVPLPDTFTTLDTVYGKCGSSYVELKDRAGDRRVHFSTGFNLTSNAIDFDWVVTIEDPGGGYRGWSDSGPMWPDDVWDSGTQSVGLSRPGYVTAEAGGTAYLANGGLCQSLGPTDTEYAS